MVGRARAESVAGTQTVQRERRQAAHLARVPAGTSGSPRTCPRVGRYGTADGSPRGRLQGHACLALNLVLGSATFAWCGSRCADVPLAQARGSPPITKPNVAVGFSFFFFFFCFYSFGCIASLPEDDDPVALAPLLCAGLIGWRSLRRCGPRREDRHLWVRRGGSHHHPGLHLAGTARLCLYTPGRRRCPGFRPLARRRVGRWLGRSAA